MRAGSGTSGPPSARASRRNRNASGEGLYPFVTHSFADAEKGAVGIIQVGTPRQFITMSH